MCRRASFIFSAYTGVAGLRAAGPGPRAGGQRLWGYLGSLVRCAGVRELGAGAGMLGFAAPGARASDLEHFFGVARGQFDLGLEEDWERYRVKWPTMNQQLKRLGVGRFWDDPEVHGWFPTRAASQLVRLGRWYATLPTSNVASERAFGVVRGLEDDQRMSAREETVTIETLARCNSWLVDVVKEKHGRM